MQIAGGIYLFLIPGISQSRSYIADFFGRLIEFLLAEGSGKLLRLLLYTLEIENKAFANLSYKK